MKPKEYLKSLGWTEIRPDIMENPAHEYRTRCYDTEYELLEAALDDGRWPRERGYSGDNLRDLQHALADLNLIDPVKFRVEELLDVLKPMIDKNRSEFLLFLDLTKYLRETSGKHPL